MRSLHADGRSRRAIWFLLIPAVVLTAWTAWFLGAHVSRYEVTDRARLEVDQAVHVLQAPIAGRVIASGLVMGRQVQAGDLVLELDAAPQQLQLQESRAHLAALDWQIAALAGKGALRGQGQTLESERVTTAKTIELLAFEITRRRILAPVSGKFGEVAILGPGASVAAGDKLCAIIPSGELRVIAEFAPSAALGRIRAGQHAHLRLQGFGSIPAHVTGVGGEIRDGTVRVELAVDPSTTIPLQNGLPGTVEVQVENVSPATLLLRAAFNRQTP